MKNPILLFYNLIVGFGLLACLFILYSFHRYARQKYEWKEIFWRAGGGRNRLSLVRKSSPKNILKPKNSEDLPAITNDFLFHLPFSRLGFYFILLLSFHYQKPRRDKGGEGGRAGKQKGTETRLKDAQPTLNTIKIKLLFNFVFIVGW